MAKSFVEAKKRYRRTMLPIMFGYCVVCLAGTFALDNIHAPPVWMKVAFCALVTAPIAVLFVILGRFLNETDEYTRHRATLNILIGGGITFTATFFCAFLTSYELIPTEWTMLIVPLFFMSFGLASWLRKDQCQL